ncbi:hypothetical protein ACFPDQ_06855 [Pseudofrancisella aestuarii]|uniref:Secreted protein n=1 Tax=Pseudofrancisella aestuarii TaxID=2670347 RepID=A0ABV9TDS2_9GAMM|nr:hypothetical protein [Pseudofrancisella aestuarii]
MILIKNSFFRKNILLVISFFFSTICFAQNKDVVPVKIPGGAINLVAKDVDSIDFIPIDSTLSFSYKGNEYFLGYTHPSVNEKLLEYTKKNNLNDAFRELVMNRDNKSKAYNIFRMVWGINKDFSNIKVLKDDKDYFVFIAKDSGDPGWNKDDGIDSPISNRSVLIFCAMRKSCIKGYGKDISNLSDISYYQDKLFNETVELNLPDSIFYNE